MDLTGTDVCPGVISAESAVAISLQVSIADVVPESLLGWNGLLEVEIRFKS